MEDWLRILILATCSVAFIACVIGGLMILFERWTPNNPNTGKFLVTGVLASSLAAVAPGKATLFPEEPVGPVEEPPGSDDPPEPRDESRDPPPRRGSEGGLDSDDSSISNGAEAIEGDGYHPSPETLEWAENTLLPPPVLDRPPGSTYPDCSEDLRRDLASPTNTDPASSAITERAIRCYGAIQSYNSLILVNFDGRRSPYLTDIEIRARPGQESNTDRLEYMQRRYADITYGDLDQAYVAISAVFSCDKDLMINLRDYGLFREAPGCPRTLP